jgi:2'-5' RNA ligase
MPRLFLAVPLEEGIRSQLVAVLERLKSADADVKWVVPENLHLTIAFLGDHAPEQIDDIKTYADYVAKTTMPFLIGLRGGSAFPKKGPLKTLWVGVNEGADAWKALARRAETAFAPFGVPHGNDLTPHITLGRVRSPRGMDDLRAALRREATTDCGTQSADRLVLMASTLDPGGAVYRELSGWPFSGESSPPEGSASLSRSNPLK